MRSSRSKSRNTRNWLLSSIATFEGYNCCEKLFKKPTEKAVIQQNRNLHHFVLKLDDGGDIGRRHRFPLPSWSLRTCQTADVLHRSRHQPDQGLQNSCRHRQRGLDRKPQGTGGAKDKGRLCQDLERVVSVFPIISVGINLTCNCEVNLLHSKLWILLFPQSLEAFDGKNYIFTLPDLSFVGPIFRWLCPFVILQ